MILSRRFPPGDYIRTGFFFALGVLLLLVLALVARRFLGATLAVITPFVVGGALALLLDPVADRLQKRGLKRTAAAAVVFVALLLILGVVSYFAIPALMQQAANLARNAPEYFANLQKFAQEQLQKHPRIGPFRMPHDVGALSTRLSGYAAGLLQRYSGGLTSILTGSVTFVIQFVLTLILTLFFLIDIDRFRARLLYLAPERWRPGMMRLGHDVGGVFSDYIVGLAKLCLMYGVATSVMLYTLSFWHHRLAGYALLVGALAGILYAVPYVGSTSTALITFLVAFASVGAEGGLAFGGLAVGLTLLLNQVFDNVLTPKIVGGGVGLHPVVSLFALVIGGELFGLWGMLLSVPIAASIQIILFRAFPKLTTPTPPDLLRRTGVPPDEEESKKVAPGEDSVTAKRQRDERAGRPKTEARP